MRILQHKRARVILRAGTAADPSIHANVQLPISYAQLPYFPDDERQRESGLVPCSFCNHYRLRTSCKLHAARLVGMHVSRLKTCKPARLINRTVVMDGEWKPEDSFPWAVIHVAPRYSSDIGNLKIILRSVHVCFPDDTGFIAQ
jgi:hypothetical protein